MKQAMMIDPPAGWMYGFPKVYDAKPGETLQEWLVREGYPRQEVEFAIMHLRSWEVGVQGSPTYY